MPRPFGQSAFWPIFWPIFYLKWWKIHILVNNCWPKNFYSKSTHQELQKTFLHFNHISQSFFGISHSNFTYARPSLAITAFKFEKKKVFYKSSQIRSIRCVVPSNRSQSTFRCSESLIDPSDDFWRQNPLFKRFQP